MSEQRKDITLQFDPWHLIKGAVKKKLTAAAKPAACRELKNWVRSICNHLWWACATCNGDSELLKEKWTSIIHHVKNKHSWDGNKQFKKCAHGPLEPEESRKKKWLREGTPPYEALQKIVFMPSLLRDLQYLTDFSHTGSLEVYHALVNKYCPKIRHFSNAGMVRRTQLAD